MCNIFSSCQCTGDKRKERAGLASSNAPCCSLFSVFTKRDFIFQCLIWNSVSFNELFFFFCQVTTAPSGAGPPQCRGLTITLRHTTLGRTPLHEWSARPTDLYLTTHSIHKTQTSMPPAVFEPRIPSSEQPQTHVLGRTATGICFNGH
jgi:hypothetical protein